MSSVLTTIVLAAWCCAAGVADARAGHGRATAPVVPGRFDYYLLTLSWSPVFCESHPGDPQCGRRRFGFVLHGLWPQLNSARRLEHCSTSQRLTDEARALGRTVFPTEKLMVHEWETHGVCSGLSALEYFQTSDEARHHITIPSTFDPGTHTQTMTAADIAMAIRSVNPTVTNQSIAVTCAGPELSDVRICLSKSLQPAGCGSGVSTACGPGPIRIPGAR